MPGFTYQRDNRRTMSIYPGAQPCRPARQQVFLHGLRRPLLTARAGTASRRNCAGSFCVSATRLRGWRLELRWLMALNKLSGAAMPHSQMKSRSTAIKRNLVPIVRDWNQIERLLADWPKFQIAPKAAGEQAAAVAAPAGVRHRCEQRRRS